MSSFTKEEYLKLIDRVMREQDEPEELDINYYELWSGAESQDPRVERAKKKKESTNTIDATDLKSNRLVDIIRNYSTIKVGIFTLQINSSRSDSDNKEIRMNITLYKTHFKTPNGLSFIIDKPHDPTKDDLFKDCLWIKQFDSCSAFGMPEEDVISVIRWLQAITKLKAFL